MRIIPLLSAGLLAAATLVAPAQAQRYHNGHHGTVYSRHHGHHYRHHRARRHRVVCSRHWYHHRRIRRCRTVWY